MLKHLRFTYSLALAAMALVAVAGEALAQTPEGTVITNTATATYTDANSNPYAAVSGSVSVTVGFKAGVTVTANTPTPSSASPSTADTMTFTVGNAGNGTDSMTISENISVAGVITVTGYRYGATTYGTLAALNTALSTAGIAQGCPVITIVSVNGAAGGSAGISLAPGASQAVTVVYNVANVAGGSTDTLYLRARSVGQPATFDDGFMDLTVIKPNLTLAKAAYLDDGVTPVSGSVVPGQVIRYRFTLTNNGGTSASSVQVTDALPAQVTYVSTSSSTGWSIVVSGQNVTGNYTGTGGVLAASASATFELRVSIN